MADVGQLGGQPSGDQRRRVGAGVVGDGDGVLIREVLSQVPVQPADAGGQLAFLVEDRHGHIEHHLAARDHVQLAGILVAVQGRIRTRYRGHALTVGGQPSVALW